MIKNIDKKTIAIVVTYNRKKLLLQCLAGIINQTHSIDAIVIIDNASIDDTEKCLNDSGWMKNPKLTYIRLDENKGGAGGFNAGIDFATKRDYDWLWLMDDDVSPELNCLATLFEYAQFSRCLHPRKLLLDGNYFNWEHSIDISTGARTVLSDISFKNGKEITYTNVGCFEGMLIARDIVDKIGLPNSDYFICEDDTLWGLKASAFTNVSYVKNAVLIKLLPLSDVSAWKTYFVIRNRFFLHRDACNFFNIKLKLFEKTIFIFSQVLYLFTFIKKGRVYVYPALKGFIEGYVYWIINNSEVQRLNKKK